VSRLLAGRGAFALVVLLCVAALGAALVSQHHFDMQPCPWCVLQRLVFVLIALVALPAAVVPRVPSLRRISALAVTLLAAAGVAAALWQHFVAASSASCKLTLADRIMGATGLDALWPAVFAAFAGCAEAAVRLFGLPYEFWSLTLFAALGALALMAWRTR
jgi:protein dithiol:quinone oxidoreductase